MKKHKEINEGNFEEIFKLYFGPLCNYVNFQIHDWELSREVVQGSFLRIWENRENIEISSSVKSYLYSTVRNRMIDHIRANKKLDKYKSNIKATEALPVEQELNPHLIRSEIMHSLGKLKPKMQKIFSLSKIEGLTYSEISSYLNISKRTVEDNIARALALMRADLKTKEYLFDS